MGFIREKIIEMSGVVASITDDGRYEVRLDGGEIITAGMDRMMRRIGVSVLAGDRVTIEMSQRDPTRTRIIFRHLALASSAA